MERICKNCRLFNSTDGVCAVTVVNKGEHYELPVKPNDPCHWERLDREIQSELAGAIRTAPSHYFKEKLLEQNKPIEVKQVRMWSNGKDGFIEYPADEVDS